jgi:hypothetical protein
LFGVVHTQKGSEKPSATEVARRSKMRTQLPVTLVVGLPVAAIMYLIVNHATSYVPGAFILLMIVYA